jgi:deoxyribonuclease V
MLKAAVDVYYKKRRTKAVCILFEQWTNTEAFSTHVANIEEVEDYEPGAFYKRELPCILKVLHQINLSLIDTIIVDGYVYLDDNGKYGLGAYLYKALGEKIPVIGVAKTRYFKNTRNVLEVNRGQSKNPLFISSIGIEVSLAASYIRSMSGEYRIPTILQYLDQKTKE